MNKTKVISELNKKYPDKQIFCNNEDNPTEIICEIEPSSKHSDHSVAIAVIDKSIAHFHILTTEIYEIIRGKLKLTIDGFDYTLKEGDTYTVNPNKIHFATGDETWVKVTSNPGWSLGDHWIK